MPITYSPSCAGRAARSRAAVRGGLRPGRPARRPICSEPCGYAVRQLAATPGFTAVAILIVAIGIGAATAMFSTVDAVVLRPLALPDADRLVSVYETNLERDVPTFSVSVPNYVDFKARARASPRWPRSVGAP